MYVLLWKGDKKFKKNYFLFTRRSKLTHMKKALGTRKRKKNRIGQAVSRGENRSQILTKMTYCGGSYVKMGKYR